MPGLSLRSPLLGQRAFVVLLLLFFVGLSVQYSHKVLAHRSAIVRWETQLIGLEAKMRQYEEGERFVAEVEKLGGPELLGLAWNGPDSLPSLDEIRDPPSWVSRVRVG